MPESVTPQTHEIGSRTYVVAPVRPLDVDGVRTVAVGSLTWLVGFLVLLPFYGRLRDDGHLWWLWTCLAGFGLGVIGWDYCRRRRRHRVEEQRRDAVPADPPAVAPEIVHPPMSAPTSAAVPRRPPGPASKPPGPGGRPPFTGPK